MTSIELLARLSALLPPPRYPLTRYHGVLAPRSAWRREIVPRAPASSAEVTAVAAANRRCSPAAGARDQPVGKRTGARARPLAPVGMATNRGTAPRPATVRRWLARPISTGRQQQPSLRRLPSRLSRGWASRCGASHAEHPWRPPLVAPSRRPALRDVSTAFVVEASAPHVRHRHSRLREMPWPLAGRRGDCGRARRPPHPRAPRGSICGPASRARPRSNPPRRRGARVRIASGVRADARRGPVRPTTWSPRSAVPVRAQFRIRRP